MILLIDNYDSFSYNLYQLIGSIAPDLQVIRNDAYTILEIECMKPDAIVISPGPGRPEHAGICLEVIRYFTGKVPILGVCLGHQAICQVFGATIGYAKCLMHGKSSDAFFIPESILFKNIQNPLKVARYHSLAADKTAFPDCLQLTAETKDGEIMAVEHRHYPIYGVQFHPESILTKEGKKIIENFIDIVRRYSNDSRSNY